ncbi:phytanoyl-CoA dioxygenase family protein [Cohnella soli]|uniref:Phytanoyl-CoA dioxygenase family protein n=1 Tax=Cohnella soli TaxID=425005 RepID=A0ABW0I0I8_9BACL
MTTESRQYANVSDNPSEPTKGFTDATPLLHDPAGLRKQAEQDSYLWFKGLLPREQVLELRHSILQLLRDRQMLDPSYPLEQGIANTEEIDRLAAEGPFWAGIPQDLYLQIQKLEAFHRIARAPELLHVYRLLFGTEPFPHPRNICRVVMPHPTTVPTPPHQDFLHIQGSENTWTCWFPLGDCPKETGGLAMLEGSHKLGLLNAAGHDGAGGLETILCGYNMKWAYDDYSAGDVIIFHSHTVHKAIPNQNGNRFRLSCDFRYQPATEVIDSSSLLPHGDYSWEEIYADWSDESLKYYWRDMNLELSAWDESIRWQKEKIC